MADEEKEEVVETPTDEPEEAQDAPEVEGAEESSPEPETPSEGQEEASDAPVPDWMRMLFDAEEKAQKPKAEEAPKPEEDKINLDETLLTEKELSIVQKLLDKARTEDRAEIERLREHIDRFVGRDVTREVKTTVAEVYQKTYNGVFKNDPVFRTNTDVAAMADAAIQNWCRMSAARAAETGDTRGLEFARDPRFGKAVLYLAKLATGTDEGTSPTIIPKGAEVESSSTGAKSKPKDSNQRIKLSKSERAEMERLGVTDQEIEEAMKLKASMGY